MEDCYFGEDVICQAVTVKGSGCTKRAYFLQGDLLKCKQHLDAVENFRCLKPNPMAEVIIQSTVMAHDETVLTACHANQAASLPGRIMTTRMTPHTKTPLLPHFRNIMLDHLTRNTPGGISMYALHPKNLGPVSHGQPEIPPALKLENYYEASKVFIEDLASDGTLKESFYSRRHYGYLETRPVGPRTLSSTKRKIGYRPVLSAKPEFYVQVSPTGLEKRYTDVQFRYFYCSQYEKLVLVQPDFLRLSELWRSGVNINVVSRQARDFLVPDDVDVCLLLNEWYVDPLQPFTFVEALICLVVFPEAQCYPWNVYKNMFPELYQ